MQQRLRVLEDRTGDLVVRADFDSIQRALRVSQDRQLPAVLYGTNYSEEVSAYRSKYGRSSYSSILIGKRAKTLREVMYPFYVGRTALLDRILSYGDGYTMIHGPWVENFVKNGRPESDFDSFIDGVLVSYVKSRRRKEGAESDFREFIRNLEKADLSGPLLIMMGARISVSQASVVHAMSKNGSAYPSVVCYNDRPDFADDEFSVERKPVTKEELISLLAGHLGKDISDIEARFSIWQATSHRVHNDSSDLTIYEASAFASFVKRVDGEDLSISGPVNYVPSRVVAPVMFEESCGRIGLDHSPVNDNNQSHAIGAARALKNQAIDLASIGSLDNALPNISRTILRISDTLDRISKSQKAEQADVVELGVDLSYFESRIYSARDKLGSMSANEALSFIGEANRFINRFDAWKTYLEETNLPEDVLVSEETSDAAVKLLKLAVGEGILTPDARAKVESVLATNELDQPIRRDGVARSGESLGAALGHGAIKASRAVGKKLGEEAANQAAEAVVDETTNFLKRHAPLFLKLAASRSGKWLAMLVSEITNV